MVAINVQGAPITVGSIILPPNRSVVAGHITTTPPPREQAEDLLNVWWMLYIVYPTCGVVGLAIILLTCFRCRYGYFPCCKVQCERQG